MGYWERRRARRIVAVTRACHGLGTLPKSVARSPADDVESYRKLTATLEAVRNAQRLAKRRSETWLQLMHASWWLSAWLDAWGVEQMPELHQKAMYRELVNYLSSVSERLSALGDAEVRPHRPRGPEDDPV